MKSLVLIIVKAFVALVAVVFGFYYGMIIQNQYFHHNNYIALLAGLAGAIYLPIVILFLINKFSFLRIGIVLGTIVLFRFFTFIHNQDYFKYPRVEYAKFARFEEYYGTNGGKYHSAIISLPEINSLTNCKSRNERLADLGQAKFNDKNEIVLFAIYIDKSECEQSFKDENWTLPGFRSMVWMKKSAVEFLTSKRTAFNNIGTGEEYRKYYEEVCAQEYNNAKIYLNANWKVYVDSPEFNTPLLLPEYSTEWKKINKNDNIFTLFFLKPPDENGDNYIKVSIINVIHLNQKVVFVSTEYNYTELLAEGILSFETILENNNFIVDELFKATFR